MVQLKETPLKKNSVKGVVRDAETNEPIAYAIVKLLNSQFKTAPSESIKFEFQLSNKSLNELVIQVKYIGYDTKEIKLTKQQFPINIRIGIELEQSEFILMGEITTEPIPKR